MKGILNYACLFWLISVQYGCFTKKPEVLSINEIVNEVKTKTQAEFLFTSVTDSFNYKLQFVPQAALFLNHYDNEPTKSQLDSFNIHKSDLVSFVLKIQPNELYKISGMKSYETVVCNNPDKMNFLTKGIAESVKLFNGSDSLKPVFYHFERSFGLKPDLTLHLAFNAKQNWSNEIVIKFHNKLTKIGQLAKFEIPNETITYNPNIKL